MYGQERLQRPALGRVDIEWARAIRRRAAAAMDAVGGVFGPFVEAIRAPQNLELLDPKLRGHMSARDKGEIDAFFHGV